MNNRKQVKIYKVNPFRIYLTTEVESNKEEIEILMAKSIQDIFYFRGQKYQKVV